MVQPARQFDPQWSRHGKDDTRFAGAVQPLLTIDGLAPFLWEVSAGADPSEWHVLTDRGETRFFLASEDGPSRRILDRYL